MLERRMYHTIQAGEDLWLVAQKYGVTIGKIIELNKEEELKKIYPGKRIRIS